MAYPRTALALAACLAATIPVSAEDRGLRLQGMFCNSEDQIDEALAQVGEGWTPRAAVALTNDDAAVCTYVDLLHYVVEHPVAIGGTGGFAPVKYRGLLVGVLVGGRLREISPPVEVFFATPERIADAVVERRT